MSDKKNENFGCGMICFMSPVLLFMGIGLACLPDRPNGTESGYVVTDKGENKIAYYSIKNPADVHVMTFDTDTVSFYPYVNIGDTITGDAQFMNRPMGKEYEPVAKYQDVQGHLPKKIVKEPVISAVNGHTLPELRQIAQRDSILRTMRQKQK